MVRRVERQRSASVRKHLVADVMAVLVVDGLEVVDVQHPPRKRLPEPPGALEGEVRQPP